MPREVVAALRNSHAEMNAGFFVVLDLVLVVEVVVASTELFLVALLFFFPIVASNSVGKISTRSWAFIRPSCEVRQARPGSLRRYGGSSSRVGGIAGVLAAAAGSLGRKGLELSIIYRA